MCTLRKIAIFMIVFACFTLQSQSPGYMGKKAVAGYGFYCNPAFGNILIGHSNSPFNIQHELFFEYALAKRISLGVSARLYRYTYNNVASVNAEAGKYKGGFDQIDENPTGSYSIKATNYLLYSKFFRSRYLAPWGKYFILGLSLNRYRTEYDPDKMYVRATNTSFSGTQQLVISDFGPTTQFYRSTDVFFGTGNSRIFGNRIVLDYGYNINILALTRLLFDEWTFDGVGYTEDYIKRTSSKRMAAVNRFNLYLKIGYLF